MNQIRVVLLKESISLTQHAHYVADPTGPLFHNVSVLFQAFMSQIQLEGRTPEHIFVTCTDCNAKRTIEDPQDLLRADKGNATGNAAVAICPTCCVLITAWCSRLVQIANGRNEIHLDLNRFGHMLSLSSVWEPGRASVLFEGHGFQHAMYINAPQPHLLILSTGNVDYIITYNYIPKHLKTRRDQKEQLIYQ